MKLLAALATTVMLGLSAAQAAPVSYTDTHLYGSNLGRVDPPGSDEVLPGSVRVRDNSIDRFSDSFDFSSFNYTTISSITLTLEYINAGPNLIPLEAWAVRVPGSNNASLTDDFFRPLVDILSPTSYVLTLGSDILGVDAFANTLSAEKLTFWFSEFTTGIDAFSLRSARIDIQATLVPLPATGLLLIAGLGGLAAFRRRQKR